MPGSFLGFFLSFLILCINFLPQRFELYLNDTLGNFPASYIGILLLFLLLLPKGLKRRRSRNIRVWLMLLCMTLFSSVLSLTYNYLGRNGGVKPLGHQILSLVYLYVPILLAPITYWIAVSCRVFNRLINIFLIIVFGHAVFALLQLGFGPLMTGYLGWDLPVFSNPRAHSSLIGGTGPLSFLLLLGVPLFFFEYLRQGGNKAVGFSVSIVALIYTYSRLPIVFCGCCILGFCFHCLSTRQAKMLKRRLKLVIIIILPVLVGIFVVQTGYNLNYLARKNVNDADSARMTSGKIAAKLCMNKPFAGYGPGNIYIRKYEESNDKQIVIENMESLKTPHNFYLLIAAEHGAICLLLWVVFMMYLLKLISPFSKSGSKNLMSVTFFIPIIAFYVASFFTDTLAIQYRMTPTFWYFVGLALAHKKLFMPSVVNGRDISKKIKAV